MYRLNDIVSSFSTLVGWKDTDLSASDSGLYFQEAHPLLTLRALRGVMPKDLADKYPAHISGQSYSKGEKARSGGKVYESLSDGNTTDVTSTDWREYDVLNDYLAYLTERGIPEDHIIMEDRSTTTEENVIFSGRIVRSREGGRRIALISSNYHVYRCLRIAAREGLKCTGIGAKVAAYYWPSALIREFAAVFFNKGFFIWSMIGYLLFVSPILLKWF